MTDEQIVTTINDVLVEEFELNPDAMKTEATLFDDLGLDSLDVVDMVIALEGAFSFKIREDPSLREIHTLGDVHSYIIEKRRLFDAQG